MLNDEQCQERVAPPKVGATAAAMPPRRILCAEDDEISRRLLDVLLTRAGHCVLCVKDGFEAWVEVVSHPDGYDVVITDHQMPRLDGLALVQRLRERAFGGKIIVVSSSLDDDLRDRYRLLEVDAMVDKPIDCARLLEMVNVDRVR